PAGEVLQCADPARFVAGARLLGDESAVFEHHGRAVGLGAKLDRDEADGAGVGTVGPLPTPGVDEAARAVDLAVLAADRVFATALVAHAQHVAPAHTQVDLAARRGPG